jgi:hypothetical protein
MDGALEGLSSLGPELGLVSGALMLAGVAFGEKS